MSVNISPTLPAPRPLLAQYRQIHYRLLGYFFAWDLRCARILVHSPRDKTIFTGDILFIEGTPIMWQGPVGNWIKACHLIEEMDVEHIVPGHGSVTDKVGVAKVRQYLEYVRGEAKARYDTGMNAFDAAKDIERSEYSSWSNPERSAVNVDSLYREFSNSDNNTDIMELFGQMAELAGFVDQK